MIDVMLMQHCQLLNEVRLIYSSLSWREITSGNDALDVKVWWRERVGVSIYLAPVEHDFAISAE
jgi:hypothetical protein